MEDKVFLDESGLGEVGKVISKFYASKDDLKDLDSLKSFVASHHEIKLHYIAKEEYERMEEDDKRPRLADITDPISIVGIEQTSEGNKMWNDDPWTSLYAVGLDVESLVGDDNQKYLLFNITPNHKIISDKIDNVDFNETPLKDHDIRLQIAFGERDQCLYWRFLYDSKGDTEWIFIQDLYSKQNVNNLQARYEMLEKQFKDKVDKVEGKDLSTNDYTNADKTKVDAIPDEPKYTDTKYDDTQVKQDIQKLKNNQLSKATQAEAETGTDDTKYMTPLATKQAIDKLAQSGGGLDKQYLYDILFGESLVTRKAGEWAVVHGKPTTIERQAFESEKLVSVTIPDSVTNIEYHAFASNRLTNVIIPNSVTNIKNGAFCDNRLTSIIIPDSITTIDINMFEGNRLTSVSIPDSVVRIGHAAFANNRLTNVTIPDSVTTIENFTFANNYLTSVVIPDSIATIEDYAFNKNKLVNVIIPNSVTSIGECAFSINKLKEVKIPKNCQVAKNAFDDGVNIIRY